MNNEQKALSEIRRTSGTEIGQYGVDEFVAHHLRELPKQYWLKHTGTESPTSIQVIELLILRSKWDGEEVYDFTLPDNVTDYVMSVSFDDSGKVDSVSMEN